MCKVSGISGCFLFSSSSSSFTLIVSRSLALSLSLSLSPLHTNLQLREENGRLEGENSMALEKLTAIQRAANGADKLRDMATKERAALLLWHKGSRGLRRAFWLVATAADRSRAIDDLAARVSWREANQTLRFGLGQWLLFSNCLRLSRRRIDREDRNVSGAKW
jgi:hypothetical protein